MGDSGNQDPTELDLDDPSVTVPAGDRYLRASSQDRPQAHREHVDTTHSTIIGERYFVFVDPVKGVRFVLAYGGPPYGDGGEPSPTVDVDAPTPDEFRPDAEDASVAVDASARALAQAVIRILKRHVEARTPSPVLVRQNSTISTQEVDALKGMASRLLDAIGAKGRDDTIYCYTGKTDPTPPVPPREPKPEG